jgi:hypothetical protein
MRGLFDVERHHHRDPDLVKGVILQVFYRAGQLYLKCRRVDPAKRKLFAPC